MITKKAGTILLNLETKKIGLVFREKKQDYSFPKGHLEPNETLIECALRETEEETLRIAHLLLEKEITVLKYVTPAGEDVENYMYLAIDDGPTSKEIDIKDREVLRWAYPDEVREMLCSDDLKEFWDNIIVPIKMLLDNNGVLTNEIIKQLI